MASSRRSPRAEPPTGRAREEPLPALPGLLDRALCAVPAGARIVVAFSGGRDSMVLLDALALARGASSIVAWHVHHGLQPAAERWPAFCEGEATRLGVAFGCTRLETRPAPGDNLEAWAREARYAALWRAVAASGAAALVTAHHADDQFETVLMRLARGSGPQALGGMVPAERRPGGWLLRPLLEVPGERLQAWAQARGLRWIEDPMNADETLLRSALRHRVLPAFCAAAPGLRESVLRSARLLREAGDALRELGEADLRAAGLAPDARSIDRRALAALPPARRSQAVRAWFRALGIAMPPQPMLAQWMAQMLDGGSAAAAVAAGAWRFRRYRDLIAVEAVRARDWRREPGPPLTLRWSGAEVIELPGWRARLHVSRDADGCGIDASRLAAAPLQVKVAAAGARLRPRAGAPSRSLKNLFQERGVPPWLRAGMPAVFAGERLLYVAGLGTDCTHEPPPAADVVRLRWQPDDPGDPRAAFGE